MPRNYGAGMTLASVRECCDAVCDHNLRAHAILFYTQCIGIVLYDAEMYPCGFVADRRSPMAVKEDETPIETYGADHVFRAGDDRYYFDDEDRLSNAELEAQHREVALARKVRMVLDDMTTRALLAEVDKNAEYAALREVRGKMTCRGFPKTEFETLLCDRVRAEIEGDAAERARLQEEFSAAVAREEAARRR